MFTGVLIMGLAPIVSDAMRTFLGTPSSAGKASAYDTFHSHMATAAGLLGKAERMTSKISDVQLLELQASVDSHVEKALRAVRGDLDASGEEQSIMFVPGSLVEETNEEAESPLPIPQEQDTEVAIVAQQWAQLVGLEDPWWLGMTKNPAWELYILAQNMRLLHEDGKNSHDDSHHQMFLHALALYFWHTAHQLHTSPASVLQTLTTDYRIVTDLIANGTTGLDTRYKEAKHQLGHTLPDYFTGASARKERSKPFAQILTCSYGSGHKSAARAVEQYLQADNWDAQSVDTTRDKDFLDSWVQVTDAGFNELVLRRQWYKLYNAYDKMQQAMGVIANPCPAPKCDNSRKDQFRAAILRKAPQLLVTVYHMDLLPVMELAKDLGNIPLLHIATDIDLKMHEVFPTRPLYPRFAIGVPFELEDSWKTITPVSPEQGFLSGYPVREEFLHPADKETVAQIRKERFPEDAHIILVMSGGGGQSVPFPHILGNQGMDGYKAHVVVIGGGDNNAEKSLASKLKHKVTFPPATADAKFIENAVSKGYDRVFFQGSATEVTVEVYRDPNNPKEDMPFFVTGSEIALLMDIADVVITKPGGGSTAELAYRGPPAVFDGTKGFLHWEEYNVESFENHSRGFRLLHANSKELNKALWRALACGRSTSIATDPGTNMLIDNPVRVAEGVKQLMQTKCIRCQVLPPKAAGHPRNQLPEELKLSEEPSEDLESDVVAHNLSGNASKMVL